MENNTQNNAENFQEKFIKNLRKKFQSTGSRMSMMLLMVDEIKLDKMKKENRVITFTEAVEELESEFNDMKMSIVNRERNIAMGEFMKGMGF